MASEAADTRPGGNNMRSLSRALEVFEILQREDAPQRLSDIARRSGMSLPTTLRMLRVLVEHGLASQTGKTYRIGAAVLPAARSFLEGDPLVSSSRPILQQLAVETGLTATLYSRLRHDRILIARVDGANPLFYDLPLGRRLPLTIGAAGKVLLAGLSDEQLQEVVDWAIEVGQEESGFTIDVLKERLPARGQLYAVSVNERAAGVMSIAVAVPIHLGPPRESLALTAPIEAGQPAGLEALAPELSRAAARLSERLEASVYG